MTYDYRDLTHLSKTEGEVNLFTNHNYNLPKELNTPLKISENGLEARMSGMRSSLIKIEDYWYKLKGCNPQPGLFSAADWLGPEVIKYGLDVSHPTKKPKGAMDPKTVKQELEFQNTIVEKLKEFDLEAALYPIARYDYKMKGRHCAISLCKGDLR